MTDPNHYSLNLVSVENCKDIFKACLPSGNVYDIRIRPGVTAKVFCVDDGWTVIQSRGQFGNPVDYFHRNFTSYQDGFGVPG